MSDRQRITQKLKMKTMLKNCLLRKIFSPPSTYFSWPRVVKPNPKPCCCCGKELLFTRRYCGAKCEILVLLLSRAEGGWRCLGWGSHRPAVWQDGQGAGTALAPRCPLQDSTKAAGRPRELSLSTHCPELVRHQLIPSDTAGVCCIS